MCWEQVWKDFGLPHIIISDCGPQFASKFIHAHYNLLGVDTSLSTAYHPQSDGQSEHMIQEVQKTLRMYVNHFQNDWASKTHTVEFALNNQIKSLTGYTPFYLVLGQHPNPRNIPRDLSKVALTIEDFISALQKEREIARKSLEKAAEEMKKFANRKRKPAPSFTIGDKVMLDASSYPSVQPSQKLSEKRYGPFTIKEKLSDLNYKLDLPSNWKIHPVFHVDKLRPYHEDPANLNFTRPPPNLVGGEEEYKVEEILDADYKNQQGRRQKVLHYFVKWKGYHSKDNTWEPFDNITNAKEVELFHKKNPKKPRNPYMQVRVRVIDGKHPEEPFPEIVINHQQVEKHLKTLENDTTVKKWPQKPYPPLPILQVKKHDSSAQLPTKGSEQAAGYNLYSTEDKVIPAQGKTLINTQLSMVVPQGTYGHIAPHSGLAAKHHIDVGAGVIDADYRGIVHVLLFNLGKEDFQVKKGDRITQLILEKISNAKIEEKEILDDTQQGQQGFGSSGINLLSRQFKSSASTNLNWRGDVTTLSPFRSKFPKLLTNSTT